MDSTQRSELDAQLDIGNYVIHAEFAVSVLIVEEVVSDLGNFMVLKLSQIEDKDKVFRSIALMWLTIISGIYNASARRNSTNEAVYEDPAPALPQDLAKLGGASFGQLIEQQRPRLSHSLTDVQIQHIEDQHRLLRTLYRDEPDLKLRLDQLPDMADFKSSWHVIGLNAQQRFPLLMEFAGGMATPFPQNATVESDFSVLRGTKDEGRGSLGDFSLQGCIHSQQHDKLLKFK